MTYQSHEEHFNALNRQLAESEHARRELADALARLLKGIPPVEIDQHGAWRHAAELVAANQQK